MINTKKLAEMLVGQEIVEVMPLEMSDHDAIAFVTTDYVVIFVEKPESGISVESRERWKEMLKNWRPN
jgi:hypothetical protein